MMDKLIKNARIAGSSGIVRTIEPSQYSERKFQYFSNETRLFTQEKAKYSSDYVEAQIQGLNPEQPFEFVPVHIRISDIVRSSSAISYEFDNYKVIDIAERQYTYLRIGAKVVTMGNTWLVINPDNMSNVLGKAIMQRCDAVWHYLDYYGNVCTEPMCFDRRLMKANDADAQRATMITKGYFDAKIQYNDATRQLFTNSRLILGTSTYKITGFSDFIQEFTETENSINLLMFDVRYEEPNSVIDDMENKVAGGKTFNWEIKMEGKPTIMVGDETTLEASSRRTAEEYTSEVESTAEHPVSYLWESSDENVAYVDPFGVVTGVSEGTATITCYLEQNPTKTAEFEMTVAGDMTEPHVAFTSNIPERLRLFETVSVTAKYYEDGEAVDDANIVFSFEGADPDSYTAEVEGNTATIKCWSGSVNPLVVTAGHGDYEASFEIELEGI